MPGHALLTALALGLLLASGAHAATPAPAASAAASAAAAIPQRPLVLVDQVGYDTLAPKRAIIQGTAKDHFSAFRIVDMASGKTVFQGTPQAAGPVDRWHDWTYWTADFSALKTPGRYRLLVTGATSPVSFPFRIADDVLERHTLSNVIYYFKGQRASGAFERADRHLPKPAGQAGTVDLSGGWYDATGDYGIHLSQLSYGSWFNTQQVPLVAWSLIATRRSLIARKDANFTQYSRRLLDEALFGADFLVRDHIPGGSFYLGVAAPGVGKLAADRRVQVERDKFQIKTKPTDVSFSADQPALGPGRWQASFRSGGGLAIAALAAASTLPQRGEFSSAQYLHAATQAYAYLAKHNKELLNDGVPNIIDDYSALLATTELYRATGKAHWRAQAAQWAQRLMARLTDHGPWHGYWRADAATRPFYNPSDAGLPVVALAQYAAIAEPAEQAKARAAIATAMAFELRITDAVNNPFGYARQLVQVGDGAPYTTFFFPHDTRVAPWWQGEDARIASLAAAARLAAPLLTGQPALQKQLQDYAWHQLHWILGRNPYATSMLIGSGAKHAQYMFFTSWQYTSAPGAIVNGITGGLDDPRHGIAFNVGYAVTGQDEDWRWTEQWLPHGAWYLYAISLPH